MIEHRDVLPSVLPALALSLLAAAPAALGQEPDEDFRPIRRGDPEELEYAVDLFPGSTHDPEIPAPEAALGQPVGSRVATHAEVTGYLRDLAGRSPRVHVERYGWTYEGRELIWAAIGSPAYIAHLDEVRANQARLHDPRGVEPAELDGILASTPAVAWMAYSIHGDEPSGSDAAMALAWHLAASADPEVVELLERVVVVIDPMMNPDGRERVLSMYRQSAGYTPALHHRSLHRGRWPGGRGNHYLFDMNRDWLPGVCPETRARWHAIRGFCPQLFVDAHEMGPLDTYLFPPSREPQNPHLPTRTSRWPAVFGADQAAAFDRFGWSYYTREWLESWYPGYSDAWNTYHGAVGILYEQAGLSGTALRRRSGEIITYRESVHHHLVSSLANLRTLAENAEEIRRDYLAQARRNLAEDAPGNQRMFVLVPGRHPSREARFVRTLAGQGIELFRSEEGFEASRATSTLGQELESRSFPAGSIWISPRQPASALLKAYLEFDPRFERGVLEEERGELETRHRSRMYDVTAWSLAHAFDLDAWWCDHAGLPGAPLSELPLPDGGIEPGPSAYGWAVDGHDDAALAFAVRAMEAGLRLHLADEAFQCAGRDFARGSLVVRRHANREGAEEAVAEAARAAGVRAMGLATARSSGEGPDLGGAHFRLLERPRVALVSNSPIRSDRFGHLWHQLDVELSLPFALLDAQALGRFDLRRFNVIVLPPAGGSLRRILEPVAEDLEAWVRSGGTLIAMESSAAALAERELGLSSVRLRRDQLEELETWRYAAWRERIAGQAEIDEERVWGDPTALRGESEEAGEEGPGPATILDAPAPPDPASHDRWLRLFAPQGALLRGLVDTRHWITAGTDAELPLDFSGDWAFLSKRPVETPIRLASAGQLRLGGLLWPEAVERLAGTSWLTVERRGHGQVILFACQPGFRGLFRGTARLFANAVVLGPGAGAEAAMDW